MTEAMPFLQKAILLSYDPRPLCGSFLFYSVLCSRAPLAYWVRRSIWLSSG